MKKLLIILIVLTACSEDEPVFKIDGGLYLESRFEKFVEIAGYYDVTVPKNNMVLRFVNANTDNINDSKVFTQDGQLYIEIDESFIKLPGVSTELIIFQQLANGLIGTPFRDCGLMKKIITHDDAMESDPQLDYSTYTNFFDPSSPC